MDSVANTERLVLSDSEREILNIVRRHGSISRADITDFTNLSQQSVYRLVDNLLQARLLKTQKAIVKGRGKPSPQITLDTSSTTSIGVSVSTNAVEYIAVDLSGSPVCSGILASRPNDLEAVLIELSELLSGLSMDGPLSKRRFIGIGVAVQGYRTTHRNRFTTPVPIDSWARIPIDEIVEERLNHASFVENNATSAAIAELYCGGGKRHRCFGYLSFNLGFGSGVIWDEKPIFGGHGNAGEISSIFLDEESHHRPALGELLKRLSDRGRALTFQQLLDEFDPSWDGITEWVDEVKPSLDLSIRALSAILDPNAIFFGGEAPAALRRLLIEACEPPEKDRFGTPKPYPELLLSELDGDAATLGAAMLPLQQIVFRNHAF
ncbi:ROK family transcriptional regulator [Nitratireductor sp. XY-223]|uniref:ROK family transcriptional regulator n=1 Tax=Nitratireductor sp. XY-223 TaxID=2561926 RepID=UPI0010A9C920|nr:ROK family transcriptional regulator [Nitratireductor sp. XY-223]